MKIETCPFNSNHRFLSEQFEEHIMNCAFAKFTEEPDLVQLNREKRRKEEEAKQREASEKIAQKFSNVNICNNYRDLIKEKREKKLKRQEKERSTLKTSGNETNKIEPKLSN